MTFKIENRRNIQGRNQRGFACNDSEVDKVTYVFYFISKQHDRLSVELERKVTDDGFVLYKIFRHDLIDWVMLHEAMICIRDIKTPEDAMDLFTQLLDQYHNKYKPYNLNTTI
jgi:hypothetical protein